MGGVRRPGATRGGRAADRSRGAVPGLVEALAAAAAKLRVGDPRDEDTDVGPTAGDGAGAFAAPP